MTPMNLERRRVVAAMQSMGWTARRLQSGGWEFRRPDSAGLWDVIKVSKQNLSWNWLMQHDESFQEIIHNLWQEVYPTRFAKVIKEITE